MAPARREGRSRRLPVRAREPAVLVLGPAVCGMGSADVGSTGRSSLCWPTCAPRDRSFGAMDRGRAPRWPWRSTFSPPTTSSPRPVTTMCSTTPPAPAVTRRSPTSRCAPGAETAPCSQRAPSCSPTARCDHPRRCDHTPATRDARSRPPLSRWEQMVTAQVGSIRSPFQTRVRICRDLNPAEWPRMPLRRNIRNALECRV